ncbi:glycogen/starch/alpha-glucan phosphorylase [Chelatococcus reniformis]|uniref:glycogen/starch/alpha-glucan phosphorylase n=1 Tax=Chelatococcus reniformis TaxID=1494448 RepID=UPI001AEE3CC2
MGFGPSPSGLPSSGRTAEQWRDDILDKLLYEVGRTTQTAAPQDWYQATAYAVRDQIVDGWVGSRTRTYDEGRKRVYYFSVEFLIGRLLTDSLCNMGATAAVRQALNTLGVSLDSISELEPDAALGNGGLGRLAACFMESLASLSTPAYGYGIRYEQGLFKQALVDGWQRELPEDWLSLGNPWEFKRPDVAYPICFGGVVEHIGGDGDKGRAVWHPAERAVAIAHDTPVPGWRGRHVNTLRLWSARSLDPMQLEAFNRGDFVGALADRAKIEAISRVLYPNDETEAGQELRLRQEFFFTSASLQDLTRRHLTQYKDFASLPDYCAIQLNDTHPSIAVAELMRLLIDEHGMAWDEAWSITTRTLNYTNHTLMPEALESWSVELLGRVLPRHLEIIYQINWEHLRRIAEHGPTTDARNAALSLIDEQHGRRVRMGHLAFLGAHRVNGVSALHTELMRQTVFKELNEVYPGKIVNKTNGITFRRWLFEANPRLTALLVETIGPAFLDDPMRLVEAAPFATDPVFVERYARCRRENKISLGRIIRDRCGIATDPASLFDVQIKRIHEYKRQLLNVLETVALYQAIKDDPGQSFAPRVKIFAGKSAASYVRAKLIIKLANDVGHRIDADPAVRDRLKLVFLPNYNVSLAEDIVPAADLSEQISTAGMEASGTGNMKLGLNGAITIGTLDGANVEMRTNVGEENIVIFGLTTPEVQAKRAAGITGAEVVAGSPRLARVIEALKAGEFSPDDKQRFAPLLDAILGADPFMVCADFDSYWEAQRRVDALWADPAAWWRVSILNTAHMGWFSSDRTIREYCAEIWGAPTD